MGKLYAQKEEGFAILGALLILALCSLLASSAIAGSRELMELTRIKKTTEQLRSSEWESASGSIPSNATLNVSPTRVFKKLHNGSKSIFEITANNSFPLAFDWQNFSQYSEIACEKLEPTTNGVFSSDKTCLELDSIDRSISGNLKSEKLELKEFGRESGTILVKGNVEIGELSLTTDEQFSLLIVALGRIDLESIIVHNTKPTTLILYSESSAIHLADSIDQESICKGETSSSLLKIISITPLGTWQGGLFIPSKITSKCVENLLL